MKRHGPPVTVSAHAPAGTPFVKVSWRKVTEDPALQSPRALADYIRNLIWDDIERRQRRRTRLARQAWRLILEEFGHRCAYCGRGDTPLQQEHRMPVALGGITSPDNIVPACPDCNRRKRTDHPDLWPLRNLDG